MKSETSLPAARARFLGLYLFDDEFILFSDLVPNNEMERLQH